jgi:hypothetical protein
MMSISPMHEEELKTRFPRGSKSFFDINVRPKESEPTPRETLERSVSGETKGDERIGLSYVLYRVRLLDPDNAVGATKTITDCLCEVGLISGDAANQIRLNVEQVKVAHFEDEKTVLNINYP